MATKNNVIRVSLTREQQEALAEIGLESNELCIDTGSGQCELAALRQPGLIRLTDEQSKSLQTAVGGEAAVGLQINPKTFGIDLVRLSDARKIKAMWGEGPK